MGFAALLCNQSGDKYSWVSIPASACAACTLGPVFTGAYFTPFPLLPTRRPLVLWWSRFGFLVSAARTSSGKLPYGPTGPCRAPSPFPGVGGGITGAGYSPEGCITSEVAPEVPPQNPHHMRYSPMLHRTKCIRQSPTRTHQSPLHAAEPDAPAEADSTQPFQAPSTHPNTLGRSYRTQQSQVPSADPKCTRVKASVLRNGSLPGVTRVLRYGAPSPAGSSPVRVEMTVATLYTKVGRGVGVDQQHADSESLSFVAHKRPPHPWHQQMSGTRARQPENCFAGGGGGGWHGRLAKEGGGGFQKWASVPGPLFCVRTDVATKGAGTQILARKITSKRVVRSSAGAYAIYPPFLGSFA